MDPWVGCRPLDVLECIEDGERLRKPIYCSEKLYQMMKDCWRFNPAERSTFGAIREDLKASKFLDETARETYNSIQPGTLQLAKGDEVLVVEHKGQVWFGQNKKNQQFGTFPRSVVFAQTNQAFTTNPTTSSAARLLKERPTTATPEAKPASQPVTQLAPATASSVTPQVNTSITTAPPKKTSAPSTSSSQNIVTRRPTQTVDPSRKSKHYTRIVFMGPNEKKALKN